MAHRIKIKDVPNKEFELHIDGFDMSYLGVRGYNIGRCHDTDMPTIDLSILITEELEMDVEGSTEDIL